MTAPSGFTRAERAQLAFQALDTNRNGVADEVTLTTADVARARGTAVPSTARSLRQAEFVAFFQDCFDSTVSAVSTAADRVEESRADMETIRTRQPPQPEEPVQNPNSNSALVVSLVGTGGLGAIGTAVGAIVAASVPAAIVVGIVMGLVLIGLMIYLMLSNRPRPTPQAAQPDREVALSAAREEFVRRMQTAVDAQRDALTEARRPATIDTPANNTQPTPPRPAPTPPR